MQHSNFIALHVPLRVVKLKRIEDLITVDTHKQFTNFSGPGHMTKNSLRS